MFMKISLKRILTSLVSVSCLSSYLYGQALPTPGTNDVISARYLGPDSSQKLMSYSKMTYEDGLSRVTTTNSIGVESEVIYGTTDRNGEIPFYPKKITSEAGVTNYHYTMYDEGGMQIISTFTPVSSNGRDVVVTTTRLRPDMSLDNTQTRIGGAKVSSVVTSGHAGNLLSNPGLITFTNGGVTRTQTYKYYANGDLEKVTGSDGSVIDYEWDDVLDRLTNSTTNGRSYTPDYSGGLFQQKGSFVDQEMESNYNEYGEQLNSTSELSGGYTTGLEFEEGMRKQNYTDTEQSRGADSEAMLDGTPVMVESAFNTPGVKYEYDVVTDSGANLFEVTATTLDLDNNETNYVRKTYYDGYGRVVKVETPHPNSGDGEHDGMVSTSIDYDLDNKEITITPPYPDKPYTIEYSDDWRMSTYTQPGRTYQSITEIKGAESSTKLMFGESELNKEVYNAITNQTTTTSLGQNPITTNISADGLILTRADHRNNSIEMEIDREGIKSVEADIAGVVDKVTIEDRHPTGQTKMVSSTSTGLAGDSEVILTESGELNKLTAPEVDITPVRDFTDGSRQDTFQNTATGEMTVYKRDKAGSLVTDDEANKPAHQLTGSPLSGTVTRMVAGQQVEYHYSDAFFLTGINRADGSATNYQYFANGEISRVQESYPAAEGEEAPVDEMDYTRDPETGFPSGYTTSDGTTYIIEYGYPVTEDSTNKFPISSSFTMRDGDGDTKEHKTFYKDYDSDNVPTLMEYDGVLKGYSIKHHYTAATNELYQIDILSKDTVIHSVNYGVDGFGRVASVQSRNLAQPENKAPFEAAFTYTDDALTGIVYDNITASRLFSSDGTAKRVGVNTTLNSGTNLVDSRITYHPTRKHKADRITTTGSAVRNVTWRYDYTDDQLNEANSSRGDRFVYNHTLQGNRAALAVNDLNQYTSFTSSSANAVTGYNVAGRVMREASVLVTIRNKVTKVKREYEVPVNEQTGEFRLNLTLAEVTAIAPNTLNLETYVLATLAGAGDEGRDAKAEITTQLNYVPPSGTVVGVSNRGSLGADWGWSYGYNSENQLIVMETTPAAIAVGYPRQRLKFLYDAESRRIQKISTTYAGAAVDYTITTKYLYNDWDLFAEIIEDSRETQTTSRFYVWGTDLDGSLDGLGGVGGLVAIHEGDKTYIPVYDATGNVVALTDNATTQTVASWQRGPFGEVISTSGDTSLCPFGFATHYTDAESGLVYFGYRYYNPETGRWLTREPLGEGESFNLFAYCHNDPINKVDILGLQGINFNASPGLIEAGTDLQGGKLYKWAVPLAGGGYYPMQGQLSESRLRLLQTDDKYRFDQYIKALERINLELREGELQAEARGYAEAVPFARTPYYVVQEQYLAATASGGVGVKTALKAKSVAGRLGRFSGIGGVIGSVDAGADALINQFAADNVLQRSWQQEWESVKTGGATGAALGLGGGVVGEAGSVISNRLFRGTDDLDKIADVAPNTGGHALEGLSVDDVVSETLKRGVKTERDQLILWSGLGLDGGSLSRQYAKQFGGKTLQDTTGGSWLVNHRIFDDASPFTKAEATEIFAQVSREVARQASGQVRALVGRPGFHTIYKTIELPELLSNSRVLGIDEIQILPSVGDVYKPNLR